MDRFASMEAFVRVVDAGSFTRAAERLGVTRAAVSKHVRQLEEHLGVRLLNRTTRQVALTETGATFYERATSILDDMAEAELAASRLNEEPRGVLRVAAPMSFGTLHLADAIGDFMTHWPDVTVQLSLNDRFVDLIEEGFDVGVRIGNLSDSSLIARKIAPMPIVLCAAPDYLRKHGAPASPDELRKHDCLHYGNLETGGSWKLEDRSGTTRSVNITSRICVNNGDVLRKVALAGQGIALLPSFLILDDVRAGTLSHVLPAYTAPEASLYALYPPNRYLAAKVRVFIDHLVAFAGANQWQLPGSD